MGVLHLSHRDAENAHADRTQLATIYREHAPFVGRSLGRLGVDDTCLDDLVQDVFLVVHRRLRDFDERRAPMRSWLYGIARGVAANFRRGRVRVHRRLELVRATPDGGVSQSEGVEVSEQVEAARIVEQFLENLSEMHREIFVLSEIEGLSGPEIARALELNLNTVYTRIRKTRRLFDRVVEHHCGEAAGR
jgi:RNA polymerase sigma-70 factor (ECF subfamily)